MNNRDKVVIGMAGAGYGAILHCNGYKRVSSVQVELKTICDIYEDKANEIKNEYGFKNVETDFNKMIEDPEIHVIDIVTPPFLHKDMIIKALDAGKHVICEKPLTGYFGVEGDVEPIGNTVRKSTMYERVVRDLDEIKEAINRNQGKFMYAENYVYAPSIQKSVEIMKNKNTKIFFLKGEESLRGSSSPVAGKWSGTGGGSLIRVGCHPLSGVLYLKQVESDYRNEKIDIINVSANMGQVTKSVELDELKYHTIRVEDVEDFANLTISFSDGTKAIIIASDAVLGGTKNYVEIYGNNITLINNLTPIDGLNSYMLDNDGMDDIQFSEMLPTSVGWNKAFISDEVIRGYTDELVDFMESIAFNREPQSNFELAYSTTKVIYAAYLSNEQNRTIEY